MMRERLFGFLIITMTLQPFTAEDITSIPLIQPSDWPDITSYFEFYVVHSSFCHVIKMVDGKEIVGTGALILNKNSSWLAHIIVRPEYRGRGCGFQITQKLVNMSNEFGCKTASLIATSMGKPVYEKLGFQVEDYYHLFSGSKMNSNHVSPQIQDLKNAKDILELDQYISGEDRFNMLQSNAKNGKIFVNKEGEIEGYYLPNFGEGLLGARTFQAAKALYSMRLAKEEIRIGVPEENEAGIQFLNEAGMKFKDRIVRMYLGNRLDRQPSMLYSRAGGYIG